MDEAWQLRERVTDAVITKMGVAALDWKLSRQNQLYDLFVGP